MALLIIYLVLFVSSIALLFVNINRAVRYKKALIYAHLILLVIAAVDLFLIIKFNSSFKTFWLDRVVVIGVLTTATLTFAIYRKTLNVWAKIYFGIFLAYPIIAAFTYLMDRIFFVIVASPLIATLLPPENYYNGKDFDIRTRQGLMAPTRLVLIKKNLLTETVIGSSGEEYAGHGSYTDFKVIGQNSDSTTVSVNFDGQLVELIFHK